MLDFSLIPDGPPIPEGYVDLVYGTAGFRANAIHPPNNLEHLAYRSGLLFASIPFISTTFLDKYSNWIGHNKTLGMGIVVTASHNPCCDNGIKFYSPSGHSLESFWEPIFTSFVNTRNPIQSELKELYEKFKYKTEDFNLKVLIGWDTRPSGKSLVSNLSLGIQSIFKLHRKTECKVNLIGQITSPTISYFLSTSTIDINNDETYITYINNSFGSFLKKFQDSGMVKKPDPYNSEELYFDCAFGLAGYKIVRFFDLLRNMGILPGLCNFHQVGKDEYLNYKSGCSYILMCSNFPENLKPNIDLYINKRFCCFDGDVDRILYFKASDPVMNKENEYKVKIIDGDRLLIVYLMFLWKLIKNYRRKLKVGVFQTRYANLASVNYIQELIEKYKEENPFIKIKHEFFNTGIKNAQKQSQKYHLSVYYETNGHGNIIFNRTMFYGDNDYSSVTDESSPSTNTTQDDLLNSELNYKPEKKQNLMESIEYNTESILLDFLNLFYPGGDAILNCLVLELAFKTLNLKFEDCLNFYSNNVSQHYSYEVPQKYMKMFISSPENESILIEPKGLQEKIEKKTNDLGKCRAFLRPSGTETLIRIYVEGETEEVVKEAHQYMLNLIDEFLNLKVEDKKSNV